MDMRERCTQSINQIFTLLFPRSMAPSSTAKAKKEKVFHPASRKAGQLARNALRKGKLGNLSTKRSQKHHTLGLSIRESYRPILTQFS